MTFRIIDRLRKVPVGGAIVVLSIALGAWALAMPRAGALGNGIQVLSYGHTVGQGSLNWSAPGLANVYGENFPGPGLGERAAQIRMPAGTLRTLVLRVTPTTAPTSGTFTVLVRINNADTAMTCQLPGSGQCVYNASTISVPNGARLAVRVFNDFTDSGNVAFTYTMLFD